MDPLTRAWLSALAGAGVVGGLSCWSAACTTTARRSGSPTRRPRRSARSRPARSGSAASIEPAEMTLISRAPERAVRLLPRRPSATAGDPWPPDRGYTEERSIGFRVRDATGSIRVFPRGARFDAPVRFEADRDVGRRAGRARHPTRGPTPDRRGRPRGGRRRAADRRGTPSESAPLAGRRRRDGRRSLPRDAARAGRRGHDRRAGAPLLRSARSGRGRRRATAPDRRSTTPRSRPTSPRPRRGRHARRRPAEAWGNAAIPGFGIGRPVDGR